MKRISLIMAIIIIATVALMADNHMDGVREDYRAERRGRTEMKHHETKKDHGMMMMHLAEELELSDQVKAEVMELQTADKKAAIKMRADLEILRIDKRLAMKNRDFKQVKKLNAEISEKRLKLTNSRVDTHESIWNLLSEEQQEEAVKMMEDCGKGGRFNQKNHRMVKPKRM